MDTESELIILAKQGDRVAAGKLCMMHRGFVYSMVKKWHKKGYETKDMIQLGYLGILDAIPLYRAESGFKFITFARFYILKQLSKNILYSDRQPETVSLDAETDQGTSLMETMPSGDAIEPYTDENAFDNARHALRGLPVKQRVYAGTMIDLCEKDEDFSLRAVANIHGVTGERIRSVRNAVVNTAAMRKFRKSLQKY